MTEDTRTAAGRDLADKLIEFLETGTAPPGLFAPDAFCDFTMPQWRLQAQGAGDIAALRKAGHPSKGRVPRSRFDPTSTGTSFCLPCANTVPGSSGIDHPSTIGPAPRPALSI